MDYTLTENKLFSKIFICQSKNFLHIKGLNSR